MALQRFPSNTQSNKPNTTFARQWQAHNRRRCTMLKVSRSTSLRWCRPLNSCRLPCNSSINLRTLRLEQGEHALVHSVLVLRNGVATPSWRGCCHWWSLRLICGHQSHGLLINSHSEFFCWDLAKVICSLVNIFEVSLLGVETRDHRFALVHCHVWSNRDAQIVLVTTCSHLRLLTYS